MNESEQQEIIMKRKTRRDKIERKNKDLK